jgi:TPP-dependent indolepyruvate ferredoxin oxidoreductase alpha subunit
MGLASSSAVAPLFGKRVVSVMGDGGFWHNGLTNGVANAMYNKQDSVLVILDNFYTSATGQHHNPSTGTNARKQPTGMTIPTALRGVGVKWIRTVDSYDICARRSRRARAGSRSSLRAASVSSSGSVGFDRKCGGGRRRERRWCSRGSESTPMCARAITRACA